MVPIYKKIVMFWFLAVFIFILPTVGQASQFFMVSGDSMSPALIDGDIVQTIEGENWKDGDIVIAEMTNDDIVVKRIDGDYLVGDHYGNARSYPIDEVNILGKVSKVDSNLFNEESLYSLDTVKASGNYYGNFNYNRTFGREVRNRIDYSHHEYGSRSRTQRLTYQRMISFDYEYFVNNGYLYYNSVRSRSWSPPTAITSYNGSTATNPRIDTSTLSEMEGEERTLANNSRVTFSHDGQSTNTTAWEYTWKYRVANAPSTSDRMNLYIDIRDSSGNWVPAPSGRGKVKVEDHIQSDGQIHLRTRSSGRFDFRIEFEMDATGYHYPGSNTNHSSSGAATGGAFSFNRSLNIDTDIQMEMLEAFHHGDTLFLETTYLPPGTRIQFNGSNSYTVGTNDAIYNGGVHINTGNFSNSEITIAAHDPIGNTGDELFEGVTLDVGQGLNEPPELTIISPYENQRFSKVEGHSSFEVTGNIFDPDDDSVTITANIGHVSNSTVVHNTANERTFEIPFDLIDDDIPSGIQTIEVVADDGNGETDVGTVTIEIVDLAQDHNYVLVDELILFLSRYEDIENDHLYQEQFKVKHDDSYFENFSRTVHSPESDLSSPYEQSISKVIDYSDQWREPEDFNFSKEQIKDDTTWWHNQFQSVGHYEVLYRAKDSPIDDDNFDEFRKWSDPTPTLNLYVHRKPVASFEPYIDEDTGEVTIIDLSYDLDEYSRGDRGIKQKWWSYREEGTYEWINEKPTSLDRFKTWEIRLRVEDYQGAFDTQIQTVSTDAIPNLPPVAGFLHENPYVVGEMVELIAAPEDPDGDTLEITYTIEKDGSVFDEISTTTHDPIGITNGEPYYYSAGATQNHKAYFHADEVGTYRITQHVSDGEEFDMATSTLEVIDLDITGFIKHIDRWEQHHIERGCGIPCNEFYSGEKWLFEAEISDYPVWEEANIEQVLLRFVGEREIGSTVSIGHDYSEPNGPSRASPIVLKRRDESNVFEGEFYEDWMTTPSERFKTGSIVEFEFEVIYEKMQDDGHINRQVRYDYDDILIIGSSYEAFDYHRKY
ncbi:S24 family peptidase [Desertibacillus haloalkaliphilus]|uniref:S24 family peptidase n=1 Tax=Desertibacillus haloalkaliphilus TaxID=1328930 RepID=UPI001C271015|nr:S24 family peptidase [Desertibacillus haloalkaliphilus]MBU8908195.1 S24/S26 family peptidase [Desertibacillus haloalkaliphilus]